MGWERVRDPSSKEQGVVAVADTGVDGVHVSDADEQS